MKFEGIYTPVITPYSADFGIDYDRLAEVIEFLINAGVHGIITALLQRAPPVNITRKALVNAST